MKKFLQRDTIYTIRSRYRSPSETEKYHHVVEIHVSQGIAVPSFFANCINFIKSIELFPSAFWTILKIIYIDEMDQMGVYQFLDIFTVEITW